MRAQKKGVSLLVGIAKKRRGRDPWSKRGEEAGQNSQKDLGLRAIYSQKPKLKMWTFRKAGSALTRE